jgi:subtilase family serine protease
MTPDGDFGNLPDGMTGTTSAMGDILHPGARPSAIPNAAIGAEGSGLQSIIPTLSAALPGFGGGLQLDNHGLNAALASLASMLSTGVVPANAATPATTPAAAAVPMASSPGGDTGGFATPLFHAKSVVAPAKAHPNAANGAAPFSPQQIQQAYGFNLVSNQGTGQTIYIVDAYNDPNISKDLATFDAQWGLPAPPSFTVHKMSNRIRNNSSWGVEESLDVEWAHSIAPQANIVLVEATSASTTALYSAVDWATNNGAHIVSMSWGGGDGSGDSSLDAHFNHSGVTYLASAGDTAAQVEYPAASPYVLAVGGTSLTLTTSNAYSSETAWSSSGGGVSSFEAQPGYQTNYGIHNSGRGTVDVSFDADPNTGVYVYDSFYFGGGGWFQVGGTSLSAPSWAGLVALADQGRSTPLSTNNLTSRTEYNAATGTVYASNYHDITTGSNGHPAGPGYDLVTGVGSPQANNLVPWLISNT